MLINPQVGMRVKYIRPNSCRTGHEGIVKEIIPTGGYHNEARVRIDFGKPLDTYNIQVWLCYLDALELIDSDQEWLDKQRRQVHAMKWF